MTKLAQSAQEYKLNLVSEQKISHLALIPSAFESAHANLAYEINPQGIDGNICICMKAMCVGCACAKEFRSV